MLQRDPNFVREMKEFIETHRSDIHDHIIGPLERAIAMKRALSKAT